MSYQITKMTDTESPITPETSTSATEDKGATDQSNSGNGSLVQDEETSGEPVPEISSEPQHITELAELRIAEKEAKDAVLQAVQKMRALKVVTAVDLSKELQQLTEIMEEFPSPPSTPTTSESSSYANNGPPNNVHMQVWPAQAGHPVSARVHQLPV
jgi:hypothetical protein